jgi:hypothetical protein
LVITRVKPHFSRLFLDSGLQRRLTSLEHFFFGVFLRWQLGAIFIEKNRFGTSSTVLSRAEGVDYWSGDSAVRIACPVILRAMRRSSIWFLIAALWFIDVVISVVGRHARQAWLPGIITLAFFVTGLIHRSREAKSIYRR